MGAVLSMIVGDPNSEVALLSYCMILPTCLRCFSRQARQIGDPDLTFGYSTPAFVKIRDRRLGLLYYTLLILIALYIVVYQVIIQQGYRKEGVIFGTARLQLREPSQSFRVPDGSVPYCSGVNVTIPRTQGYSFPNPGVYSYNGQLSPQGQCVYFDATQVRLCYSLIRTTNAS